MTQYRLTAKGHTPGDVWNCTFHVDNAVGGGTVQQALQSWQTAWSALWDNGGGVGQGLHSVVAPAVGTDVLDATLLDPNTGNNIDRAVVEVALVGSSGAESLPAQCAVAASFRTAKATRAGRGRMYLPPMTVNILAGLRIVAGIQTQILTAVSTMLFELEGALYRPIIYHRAIKQPNPPGPPTILRPPSFDIITQHDVGDIVDTQRRRRNKFIENRMVA